MAPKTKKAPKTTIRHLVPPEDLVIVGLDVENDGSVLNDDRIRLPLDEDLVDSIMRHGVKKDILCRKNPATNRYEVVDGRQRTISAREANRRLVEKGEKPIEVAVRLDKGSDALMFELQITLNQHVDSTPLMRAREMELFYNRCGDVEMTCRVCRISKATFNGWMSLLQMDEKIHEAVDTRQISSNQALQWVKLTREQQRETLKRFLSMGPKSRRKKTTDKDKMPSKAALLNIVTQAPKGVDPAFLLGLKYALGMISAKEVPGLSSVKTKRG